SNGTMRVYIDGVQVGSTTGVNLPASIPRTRSYLGKSNWPNDPLFRGSMRDIRIWDVARTAAQIQLGMTQGSITGAQTGLVACYPTGLTGAPYLNDTSGNANHLLQQGQTTFVENAIFFPGSNTHTGNTNLGDSSTLEANTALALGSGSLRLPCPLGRHRRDRHLRHCKCPGQPDLQRHQRHLQSDPRQDRRRHAHLHQHRQPAADRGCHRAGG
ncbi:MAG: LamG domain-containing protein, partial [Betaproteobacteria bacterium]|nr:LamG domain-containing protein [Betaproteobacteria bacterium]